MKKHINQAIRAVKSFLDLHKPQNTKGKNNTIKAIKSTKTVYS